MRSWPVLAACAGLTLAAVPSQAQTLRDFSVSPDALSAARLHAQTRVFTLMQDPNRATSIIATLHNENRRDRQLLQTINPFATIVQGTDPSAPSPEERRRNLQQQANAREGAADTLTGAVPPVVDNETIVSFLRPGLMLCDTSILDGSRLVDSFAAPSRNFLAAHTANLRSVARFTLSKRDGGNNVVESAHIGTGFAISPRRVLTALHVLTQHRVINAALAVTPGFEVVLDFSGEDAACRRQPLLRKMTRVVAIAPGKDMALIEIDADAPAQVAVAAGGAIAANEQVATIGYPSKLSPEVQFAMLRIPGTGRVEEWEIVAAFPPVPPDGTFRLDVKRFMPGLFMDNLGQNDVNDPAFSGAAFKYDSSTLAGNSGAPVFRLRDGALLGLHRAAIPKSFNIAVTTAEIAGFVAANP